MPERVRFGMPAVLARFLSFVDASGQAELQSHGVRPDSCHTEHSSSIMLSPKARCGEESGGQVKGFPRAEPPHELKLLDLANLDGLN
jgi:hypothetical protein